jgi:hypothetical protein
LSIKTYKEGSDTLASKKKCRLFIQKATFFKIRPAFRKALPRTSTVQGLFFKKGMDGCIKILNAIPYQNGLLLDFSWFN